HFGSKDGLISALLEYLAILYSNELDMTFSHEPPADRRECIVRSLKTARTEAFRPFMRIWWEIVAAAANGDTAYRENADIMAARLLQWFEDHMPMGDPDPQSGAKLLFTLTEGAMMLDALGRGDIADAGIAAADL
ncbi:MAG: TetR/AcrR family transcriptional regulator, partial [Pontixanthobacter sp.]